MEYRIPKTMPAYIEVERDLFRHCEEATGADWKKAKQFARDRRHGGRAIHAMARLAEVCGVPDGVPLLPRLLALAHGNVTPLVRH